MIFYLTYNDTPSGIFSSQVIDVVKFLKKEFKEDVRLVAFISLRNYVKNRKKIKQEYPESIVCPMFPGVHRWRYNGFLLEVLVRFNKPAAIIGRSVLATQLALKLRKKELIQKTGYDGRGAIAAEWKEYGVINNPKMLEEIDSLEKEVVLRTDFRIAVSNALINFWETEYNYDKKNGVVIPCTLNKVYEDLLISEELIFKSRAKIGFNSNDIVFVYSGSVAGWQSFELLYSFIQPLLSSNRSVKLLFLCDKDENVIKLMEEFKDQIICNKVSSQEVPGYLLAADYGLLLREKTLTNKVASPVKFAEYLACGLDVIISDDLGDYSKFVLDNACGDLFSGLIMPRQINIEKKIKNRELALQYFTKRKYINEYRQVLCSLNGTINV